MKSDNSSFERVEEFKYMGRILTNQNSIQEEMKNKLNSRNACYLSFGAESFVFEIAIKNT